jgi:hypothetical protein
VATLLVLVERGKEENIFRNLLTAVVMQLLMGAIEQALLMAKFKLRAPQWM